MKYFEQGGLRGSVLGFGCGSAMGRVGRRDSLRAMSAAWEAGVNVFDVARSYGYGEAEGLLGEFLRGRRSDAVIATKFGISPGRPSRWKSAAKPIARTVLRLLPKARPLVRGLAASDTSAAPFTVPLMRASLETSLRQLGTDHVDVLFMHGPPASVLENDDLMAELDQVITEGKVRVAGLSGGREALGLAVHGPAVVQALQTSVNFFDLSGIATAKESDRLFMANHPFGGLVGIDRGITLLGEIGSDESVSAELRDKLRCVDKRVLADAVLWVALRGTRISTVVPSMMNLDNLRANVEAIEHSQFTDQEIDILRSRLGASDLTTRTPTPAERPTLRLTSTSLGAPRLPQDDEKASVLDEIPFRESAWLAEQPVQPLQTGALHPTRGST